MAMAPDGLPYGVSTISERIPSSTGRVMVWVPPMIACMLGSAPGSIGGSVGMTRTGIAQSIPPVLIKRALLFILDSHEPMKKINLSNECRRRSIRPWAVRIA
jgi:hypothetical protein